MLDHVDLQQLMVLDIETVPQYPAYVDVPQPLTDLWDQKTQYQRRLGESAEEYYDRAGIWAEFGKIVCLSVGMFTKVDGETGFRVKSFAADDEKTLLEDFCKLLNRKPATLTLCAHNGKEFDFPYICRRLLINCLAVPRQLRIAGKKPWEIRHLDTMELWKFGDHKHYTSLNLLAAIFGIPTPKDDINGADVHRVYWQDKDLKRICIYCQKDVITTAQLLLRYKCLPLIREEHISYASAEVPAC